MKEYVVVERGALETAREVVRCGPGHFAPNRDDVVRALTPRSDDGDGEALVLPPLEKEEDGWTGADGEYVPLDDRPDAVEFLRSNYRAALVLLREAEDKRGKLLHLLWGQDAEAVKTIAETFLGTAGPVEDAVRAGLLKVARKHGLMDPPKVAR